MKENKEETAGAVQVYEAKLKAYMQVLGGADPDETERTLKLQLEEAEKQVQLADKAHNEMAESYSGCRVREGCRRTVSEEAG